jgi:hypothetical protein
LSSNTIHIGNVLQDTQNKNCSKVCAQRGSASNPCNGTAEALDIYNAQYTGKFTTFLYQAGDYDGLLTPSTTGAGTPLHLSSKISMICNGGSANLSQPGGYQFNGEADITDLLTDYSSYMTGMNMTTPVLMKVEQGQKLGYQLTNTRFTASDTAAGLALSASGQDSNISLQGYNMGVRSDTPMEAMAFAADTGATITTNIDNLKAVGTSLSQTNLVKITSDAQSFVQCVAPTFSEFSSQGYRSLAIFNNVGGSAPPLGRTTPSVVWASKGLKSSHAGAGAAAYVTTDNGASTLTNFETCNFASSNSIFRFNARNGTTHLANIINVTGSTLQGKAQKFKTFGSGKITALTQGGTYTTGSPRLLSPFPAFENLSGEFGTIESTIQNANLTGWTQPGVPLRNNQSTDSSIITSNIANSIFKQLGPGDGSSTTATGTSTQTHNRNGNVNSVTTGTARTMNVDAGATATRSDVASQYTQEKETPNPLNIVNVKGTYNSTKQGTLQTARTTGGDANPAVQYVISDGGNFKSNVFNAVHTNLTGAFSSATTMGSGTLEESLSGSKYAAAVDCTALQRIARDSSTQFLQQATLGITGARALNVCSDDTAAVAHEGTSLSTITFNEGDKMDPDNGMPMGSFHFSGAQTSSTMSTWISNQSGAGSSYTAHDTKGTGTHSVANASIKTKQNPNGDHHDSVVTRGAALGVRATSISTNANGNTNPSSLISAHASMDPITGNVLSSAKLNVAASSFAKDGTGATVSVGMSGIVDDTTTAGFAQIQSTAVPGSPTIQANGCSQVTANSIAVAAVAPTPMEPTQQVIAAEPTAVVTSGSNMLVTSPAQTVAPQTKTAAAAFPVA